jgi:hypothetical protein
MAIRTNQKDRDLLNPAGELSSSTGWTFPDGGMLVSMVSNADATTLPVLTPPSHWKSHERDDPVAASSIVIKSWRNKKR